MHHDITAIILAGGQGRRFEGKDKGLIEFNGIPLVAHLINTFSSQVEHIIISANRNLDIYQNYGYPVVSDAAPLYQGPMAGIAAGLNATKTDYAFVVACDMPVLPANIIQRLYEALVNTSSDLALAHDGVRAQPLCMLLKRELRHSLQQSVKKNELKVIHWIGQQSHCLVDCSDIQSCFKNINTEIELNAFCRK